MAMLARLRAHFNFKSSILQLTAIVLSNWAAIAMLAIAFQLVYLPTGVFFLALAGFYVAAPYALLTLSGFMPSWIAGICTLVSGTLVGVLCDKWNHLPLDRANATHGVHLIASLGLYIVTVQLVAMAFGNDVRVLTGGEALVVNSPVLKLRLSQASLLAVGATVVCLYLVLLRWTNAGLRLRALADDPQQFELFGHPQESVRAWAVGAAGGITALTATLSAYDQGFEPHGGLHILLTAIVAVIIGGRGSFLGPLIGALVLAVVRESVSWLWSTSWREFATFLVLCIFLAALPRGIVPGKTRIESEAR
jgi:branched-chain amino acid transport system permease protein